MKAVEWSDWVQHRRAMAGTAAAVADRGVPQPGRPRRARTPEEREMIVRGTVALMRNREREGRLVRIGPRRYRLSPVGHEGPPCSAGRTADRRHP